MKANELRIGNIIGCDIQSLTVRAVNDQTCICQNNSGKPYILDLEDLYGLKLTEEWLVKLGFEKIVCGINPQLPDFILNGVTLMTHTQGFYILDQKNGWSPFYYVHQLQNLYFALTREELEIKE